MSRDLKDLIDALEEKNQEQTEFEVNVRDLKEEIERLKFTNKEQKRLIQEQKENLSKRLEVPEDIQLLKDVIVSQRQEIKKKERDIEILEQKLEDIEVNNEISNPSQENDDLIDAQKLIIQLTEENEMYQLNESSAKKLIKELTELNDKYLYDIKKLKRKLEKIKTDTSKPDVNNKQFSETEPYSSQEVDKLKKYIEDLEDENERIRKRIESADITHNNLLEEIEVISKQKSDLNQEISEKNIKIDVLNEKIETLKRQNNELKENIAFNQNLENISKEKAEIEDFTDINNSEIVKSLKQENLELKNSINKLSESRLSIENLKADNLNLNNVISELILNQSQVVNHDIATNQFLPKFYQANLFMRIFNILDSPKKDLLIKILIQDLMTTQNDDIKRSIINLLSSIKDKRIYDVLIKMINDDDWLTKLYVIKSLYNFDDNDIKNNFAEALKKLLKDKDSDVREAASSLLSKIS